MVESTGHDSGEMFIHDDVTLRADVACLRIWDSSHGGRMTWRETQTDALMTSGLKFWQFVQILKLRGQNTGGCAPNLSTTEGITQECNLVPVSSSTGASLLRSLGM